MAESKSGKVAGKSLIILQELINNPEGLRIKTLSKLTNFKERTLYRHLYNLSKANLIEHNFPIYQIAKNQYHPLKMATLLNGNKIQAHKFSFILRLIDKPNWWDRRANKLIKLKGYQFKKGIDFGNNNYQQLQKDNFLIHTFKNTIFFINQKQYWNNDSYNAFQEALEDTLEMLRFLEERFSFKFFKDGIPQFSVRTNHFVKLRDAFANHCKKHKKLFRLEINNQLRAYIDLSDPFGTEFGHKDYAVEDISRYSKQVEDFIVNNPPTNTEIAKITENLEKRHKYIQKELKAFKTQIMKDSINDAMLLKSLQKNQSIIIKELKNLKGEDKE